MNKTKIEWSDYTVNPIRAKFAETATRWGRPGWSCVRVSPGCKNCYASTLNKRFGTWLDYAADQQAHVEHYLDEKSIAKMLTFRATGPFKNGRSRPAVFVQDMADLFGEWVKEKWLDRLFAVFALRSDVDWLLLTKRPERMREYLSKLHPRRFQIVRDLLPSVPEKSPANDMVSLEEIAVPAPWPLPNVFLGVSVENQAAADERIPLLLETPAAVRFLSVEPLLESVTLPRPLLDRGVERLHVAMSVSGALRNRSFDGLTNDAGRPLTRAEAESELRRLAASGVKLIPASADCDGFSDQTGCPGHRFAGIDWVIVGGESGPRARRFEMGWAESLRDECAEAGVPFFLKQLGGCICGDFTRFPAGALPMVRRESDFDPVGCHLKDRKGGDMSEWPEDLRVRQMPGGEK